MVGATVVVAAGATVDGGAGATVVVAAGATVVGGAGVVATGADVVSWWTSSSPTPS